tara:strand:+ start:1492 stop:2922 length:1431 start_codon:yes stop_codon:yes gene_type:complete
MSVLATPGYQLQPSAEQVALSTNYITNFDFLNQYLPDTYEKEFERYGNRTVGGFLRMVGAEMPSNSDMIKWAEQGRLHTKYTNCSTSGAINADSATITVSDTGVTAIAIRAGQTVYISKNSNGESNKGIVTSVDTTYNTFTVAYYEASGQTFAVSSTVTVWVYGSEFKKGTEGMIGSLEAEDEFFENSPIILKDKYSVNGSDMAQIGWVEITTENGATGFLWYMKSEHETRLRFDDYLETSMIEAVPAETGSGAANASLNPTYGNKGSEGMFYVINDRGNVWGAGNPTTMADFDTILSRMDKQGSIQENVLFLNRAFSLDVDDMLAAQNSYGAGGTSYGLFNNDKQMSLDLGFTGFRRGSYDFYKQDWKYLNDPTMRGGLFAGGTAGVVGTVNGVMVPAGSTTVYDQVLGKNAKRPFLHVRYRASQTENRKYKTWITGSAGGAATSDLDAMEVNFLSERCLCTLGANNFMLFRYGL